MSNPLPPRSEPFEDVVPFTAPLFPLIELPNRPWMPRRPRNGGTGKVNRFTCVRWALHGKGGTRLRTIMVGGVRCTCDTWAWEFFEALTRAKSGAQAAGHAPAGDFKHAEAELAAEGF